MTSPPDTISSSAFGPLPPYWSRQWSKSQSREYFFNESNGVRVWHLHEIEAILPTIQTNVETKRARTVDDAPSQPIRVAIIVPFRDLHPTQKRKAHLIEFSKYMPLFLQRAGAAPGSKIVIVEQSDDGRKFNRGKLLNIGFDLALKEPLPFDVFVFHDVDLIPDIRLGQFYVRRVPPGRPFHIARCWNRYSKNPEYFGGIVCFNRVDYETIDGFPNIYWGWGGEDDELKARVDAAGFTVDYPNPEEFGDCVKDLEEMTLDEKLAMLRENREWKCQKKWEANDEHKKYRANQPQQKPAWWGLRGIRYGILAREISMAGYCDKITVDVQLNFESNGGNHWTNSSE